MSTYHGDQRAATAAVGQALAARGWTLVGYKPDRSESQSDYYDPATWDGIARKAGAVALVDVSKYHAEGAQKPSDVYGVADGPCFPCKSTGRVAYRLVEKPGPHPGIVYVSDERGDFECERCAGAGHHEDQRITGQEPPACPLARACPGRWMVLRESDGRVLGTGQRPLAAGAWRDEKGAAAACADDIDSLLTHRVDGAPRDAESVAGVEVDGATVRPSTVRAGYVEVVHGSKPAEEIRAELKGAGFRWALRSRCWYGPTDRLPARYRTATPDAARRAKDSP